MKWWLEGCDLSYLTAVSTIDGYRFHSIFYFEYFLNFESKFYGYKVYGQMKIN